MRAAIEIGSGRVVAFEGEDVPQRARVVSPREAREFAAAGRLVCVDPDCLEPVRFVSEARDGSRRPHWAHPRGAGAACARLTGEGEWHRRVARHVFLGADHEVVVEGARVDASVGRLNGGAPTAIEVQHSPIDVGTVRRRHEAHAKAGFAGTVWVVDGRAHAPAPEPSDSSSPVAAGGFAYRGRHATPVVTRWLVELIEECGRAAGYHASVMFLWLPEDETLDVVQARLVARTVGLDDGSLVVTKWSKPVVSLNALREWSRGRGRAREGFVAEYRVLDSMAVRRVKPESHFFDVAVRDGRVRVVFSAAHRQFREEGVERGLFWVPDDPTGRPFSDGQARGVGRLRGPLTPAVADWLADSFGFRVGGHHATSVSGSAEGPGVA